MFVHSIVYVPTDERPLKHNALLQHDLDCLAAPRPSQPRPRTLANHLGRHQTQTWRVIDQIRPSWIRHVRSVLPVIAPSIEKHRALTQS